MPIAQMKNLTDALKLSWIPHYFRRNKQAARWNDAAIIAGLACGITLFTGTWLHNDILLMVISGLSLAWLVFMFKAFYCSKRSVKST